MFCCVFGISFKAQFKNRVRKSKCNKVKIYNDKGKNKKLYLINVLHTTVVQIRANKEPLQLGTHNLDDRLLLLKEQKNINKST